MLRYLTAAGHRAVPLFRQVRRGGHGSNAPLRAESVRARTAAISGTAGRIGGYSLRVGSARDLAAAGASVAELQQAGGWRSPSTPGVLHQARSRRPGSGSAAAVPGGPAGSARQAWFVEKRWIGGR